MPSKSKGKLTERDSYKNPVPDVGLDTDLLTEQELKEAGFRENRRLHNNEIKKICSDCGRKIKHPVTSYIRHGFDFVQKGEILHEKCAKDRYDSTVKFLKGEL